MKPTTTNSSKIDPRPRQLTLRRDTLKQLTSPELGLAVGGSAPTGLCCSSIHSCAKAH